MLPRWVPSFVGEEVFVPLLSEPETDILFVRLSTRLALWADELLTCFSAEAVNEELPKPIIVCAPWMICWLGLSWPALAKFGP